MFDEDKYRRHPEPTPSQKVVAAYVLIAIFIGIVLPILIILLKFLWGLAL